ncbi:MAG: type II secretion system protein [Candidatus Sericytochromatia bacterium]
MHKSYQYLTKKNNSGFSLVETIISIAILMVVLSSITSTLMYLINSNKLARKVDASNQLIRTLLEKYSSKSSDVVIPTTSTPVTALIKPESIDIRYKGTINKEINDKIRIAVFPSQVPPPAPDPNRPSIPVSINNLYWIKIVAYEKKNNKLDTNLTTSDLRLLSQVTSIINN